MQERNLWSYVDFEKLCNVVKYYTELNQKIVKEGIDFPIQSSSRDIKWQKKYLNEL